MTSEQIMNFVSHSTFDVKFKYDNNSAYADTFVIQGIHIKQIEWKSRVYLYIRFCFT